MSNRKFQGQLSATLLWMTSGKIQDFYIRCFHVYKDIWEQVINKAFPCIQEPETMSVKLKNSFIASRATGEKVNRGGAYGLEIPCEYLVGDMRAVDSLFQKVEKEKESCKNLVAVKQGRKC